MKLLLLDLDGTVRRPKSGARFINVPDDQEIIPEARVAIARYVVDGWQIVGCTNQGGIASGHKSLQSAIAEQQITLDLVPQLKFILFCPDFEGAICYQVSRSGYEKVEDGAGNFRKPGAGMLKFAINKLLPTQILYVGDRDEDKGAAEAAEVPFLWHEEWWFSE